MELLSHTHLPVDEVVDEGLTGTWLESRDSHHPIRNGTSMAISQVQLVRHALAHSGYLELWG